MGIWLFIYHKIVGRDVALQRLLRTGHDEPQRHRERRGISCYANKIAHQLVRLS